MSKDKPEVGDVWLHSSTGDLLYIIESSQQSIDFIGFSKYDNNYYRNIFLSLSGDARFENFTKYHIYLGKSKASIEQLFEVENEE